MRSTLLLVLVACSPEPLVLELPRVDGARALVITVQMDDQIVATATLDADENQPGPPAVTGVGDGDHVVFSVLGFGAPLDTLGLVPGVHTGEGAAITRPLGGVRDRASIQQATISGGKRTPWLEVEEIPPELAALHLPAKRGCRKLVAKPLSPLRMGAAFVFPVGEHFIMGSEDHKLWAVPKSAGDRVEVTPTDPALLGGAENFPTWGAYPIDDRPDQLWLSGQKGEFWRVRFDANGRPIEILDRLNNGLTDGVRWIAGSSTSDRTDIAFVGLEGSVGRFDGSTFTILHKYELPAHFHNVGGMGRDADGTFVGGFGQDDNLALISPSGSFSLRRLGDDGLGVAAIRFVPDFGLVLSNARGVLFRRDGGDYVEIGDSGISSGGEAIVPVEGGFIVAGSSGSIREFRIEGGLCDKEPPTVLQNLRFWTPTADGFLVTGTVPNAGVGIAPVTRYQVQ